MTTYILNSQSVDYNFDLLHQLSLINKEGTISQTPEEYQQAKEFRSFFKTYSKYIQIKGQGTRIVNSIIDATRSLIIQAKTSIYNFIWSLPGFRMELANYPTKNADGTPFGTPFNGADYTTKSIFSPVISINPREYTSNRASFRAFKSLSNSMEKIEFDAVFDYLMKIVRANLAYTYDRPDFHASTLSTYELLGLILPLMFRLLENNKEHIFEEGTNKIKRSEDSNSNRCRDIWDLINILYFTLFDIKKNTTQSYQINNDRLLKLTEEFGVTHNTLLTSRIKEVREKVEEGTLALERLVEIVKLLDVKFVDSIIFDNSDHILENLDTSAIFRLRQYILERKIKKNTQLSRSVCKFCYELFQTRAPAQIKSEYIRLVMAYNLHNEYAELGVNLDDEGNQTLNHYLDTLTTYLQTDARKLEGVSLIHSLDILDHFSGHLFVISSPSNPNYDRCVRATRLYLGYLKDATELYERIVSVFLEASDSAKPNIIKDMLVVAGYCKDLIPMIGQIGNEALEYIEPLLALINKVVNTKQLMRIPDTINEAEIAVINEVGPTYITKFTPLLRAMLQRLSDSAVFISDEEMTPLSDEWRMIYSMYHFKPDRSFSESVFRMVLSSESINILKTVFNINLDDLGIQYVRVSGTSDSDISSDYLDALTYDLIVSPVAIPINSDSDSNCKEVVIVNQRTMHTILLDGMNPFTRQLLSYDDVSRVNSDPEVQEKLHQVMDFIRRLTN